MHFNHHTNVYEKTPCQKCGATTFVKGKTKLDNPLNLHCSGCGNFLGYFCPICPETFKIIPKLKTHFEKHKKELKVYSENGTNTTKCTCLICKHKITYNTALLHHQQEIIEEISRSTTRKVNEEAKRRKQQEISSRTRKITQQEEMVFEPPANDDEDENSQPNNQEKEQNTNSKTFEDQISSFDR